MSGTAAPVSLTYRVFRSGENAMPFGTTNVSSTMPTLPVLGSKRQTAGSIWGASVFSPILRGSATVFNQHQLLI